jgi:hypothetical protein
MSDELNRRKYASRLLAVSSGVALAGCGSSSEDTTIPEETTEKYIVLPENDGLDQYDQITEGGEIATINWSGNILLYEDTNVVDEINQLTLGSFSQSPARVVGTIYIEIDGLGSSLVDKEKVEDEIAEIFQQELESFGINRITETTSDASREYAGRIQLDEFTVPSSELPGTEPLTIDPDPINITAGFDVYPTESNNKFKGHLWISPEAYRMELPPLSITGELNEGIDAYPQLSLNFGKYSSIKRSELAEQVKNASPKTL